MLSSGPALATEPADLYAELCAGCHGQRGAPLADSPYPALYANPRIAAGGPVFVANKTLHGAGNMYPFCNLASDAEVAALSNHLASENGNRSATLTEAVAAALRPSGEDCPQAEH
jgi:mono/diheme cytochrome c family protein